MSSFDESIVDPSLEKSDGFLTYRCVAGLQEPMVSKMPPTTKLTITSYIVRPCSARLRQLV